MSAESQQNEAKMMQILRKTGISRMRRITDTLQGSIWRALWQHDSSPAAHKVVVKVTNKHLAQSALAKVGDSTVCVAEDIVAESMILKYLTARKDCPPSIVRYRSFLTTDHDYVLVMEDGGSSLLEFVIEAHKLIEINKIAVAEWLKLVKIVFKQMIECTEYIHAKNICHLDISMENFVMNRVFVRKIHLRNSDREQVQFVTDDIQIKLIDFGLAELFNDGACLCNKWCGKPQYKSPEVVSQKNVFDAKKNDIWCLGVCLFMMSTGTAPWSTASDRDDRFRMNRNGLMKNMLESWNALKFVDADLLDLFRSIFQAEASRISLPKIKEHAWVAFIRK